MEIPAKVRWYLERIFTRTGFLDEFTWDGHELTGYKPWHNQQRGEAFEASEFRLGTPTRTYWEIAERASEGLPFYDFHRNEMRPPNMEKERDAILHLIDAWIAPPCTLEEAKDRLEELAADIEAYLDGIADDIKNQEG